MNNEERTKLTRLTSVVSLEEQNASIQNLFGKLKKKSYKKHIEGLDFMRIPNEILKTYLVRCEYEYLEISGFGKIPVHKFPLLAAEDRNLVVPEHCFKAYAEGFIEGYNNSLVPFVDTPESRKEKIIIEAIGKGGKGFTEHHGDDVDLYLPEDFYNLGIFEGKRYKAWSYILDTPLQFIEYFKQDQREAVLQKKLPEKWYALYHMILIANGKQVPNLSSGSKVEIIKYGKEHYGTNQGFYRVLKEIDLNKMTAYIRSLPNKDRHQWKQIIIELSDKDADVMAWLNKQPN